MSPIQPPNCPLPKAFHLSSQEKKFPDSANGKKNKHVKDIHSTESTVHEISMRDSLPLSQVWLDIPESNDAFLIYPHIFLLCLPQAYVTHELTFSLQW